jgi:hypothetical protein
VSSRFCESCVCLSTCLYPDTLNWIWKNPRAIDRTSFLCSLTRAKQEVVSTPYHLVSPSATTGPSFWTFLLPPFLFLQRLNKQRWKKKSPGPVTLMKNNFVSLGLSGKIIR